MGEIALAQEVQRIDCAVQAWAMNYLPQTRTGCQSSAFEVGNALKEIKDSGLYLAKSDDFYVYCAQRFGMRPKRVDAYIATVEGSQSPASLGEETEGNENEPTRFVYFIRGGGLIKIGVANDVASRFRSIRTMSPVPLELLGFIEGDKATELSLHAKFAGARRHGEWFEPIPALQDYIKRNVRHA